MKIERLKALTEKHQNKCKLYKDYVECFFSSTSIVSLEDVPYLPVRAFKDFELKSIDDDCVFKTMSSSGTTGKQSKIFLDKETALMQSRVLAELFGGQFGKKRCPMLIIDSENTASARTNFSARTAAINGFSIFSRKREFALNADLSINFDKIHRFLEQNKGQDIFIFGFTFLIWQFIQELCKSKSHELDLSQGFIVHGGGWKKLEAQKVSNEIFKKTIKDVTGCSSVHNYYGMVEQTGTIFIECEGGCMHASSYSDVIVRDIQTHEPLPEGSTGLIQVFSTIQESYPGHSILTEDIGRYFDGKNCSCGRLEAIVEIDGRLPSAEIRGCSDAIN